MIFFSFLHILPPPPHNVIQKISLRKLCENCSHRTALKPNSARGWSMGVLFNKKRTSCLANLIGYGGIMSSTEQQEQGRNTHYTFFKLTIDGRQRLHFLSLPLQIICTKENENYEKLLTSAPTVFMPHQPEEAKHLAAPISTAFLHLRESKSYEQLRWPLGYPLWNSSNQKAHVTFIPVTPWATSTM